MNVYGVILSRKGCTWPRAHRRHVMTDITALAKRDVDLTEPLQSTGHLLRRAVQHYATLWTAIVTSGLTSPSSPCSPCWRTGRNSTSGPSPKAPRWTSPHAETLSLI